MGRHEKILPEEHHESDDFYGDGNGTPFVSDEMRTPVGGSVFRYVPATEITNLYEGEK